MPSLARASMLGVWISAPKQPMSEKPRSSARMTMMFGCLAVASAKQNEAVRAKNDKSATWLKSFCVVFILVGECNRASLPRLLQGFMTFGSVRSFHEITDSQLQSHTPKSECCCGQCLTTKARRHQ